MLGNLTENDNVFPSKEILLRGLKIGNFLEQNFNESNVDDFIQQNQVAAVFLILLLCSREHQKGIIFSFLNPQKISRKNLSIRGT